MIHINYAFLGARSLIYLQVYRLSGNVDHDTVDLLYYYISDSLTTDRRENGWNPKDFSMIKASSILLNKSIIETFHGKTEHFLYTLKSHLIDHFAEHWKR